MLPVNKILKLNSKITVNETFTYTSRHNLNNPKRSLFENTLKNKLLAFNNQKGSSFEVYSKQNEVSFIHF